MHNFSIFHPPVKTLCLTDIREISSPYCPPSIPVYLALKEYAIENYPIRNKTIQDNKTSNLLLLKRLQNAEFCAAVNE